MSKKVFEALSILILDLMLGMVSVKMGSIKNIFLDFKKKYSLVSFCSIGRLDMHELFYIREANILLPAKPLL